MSRRRKTRTNGKRFWLSKKENDDEFDIFDVCKEEPVGSVPKTVKTLENHFKEIAACKEAAVANMDALEVMYKYALTQTPEPALTKLYVMRMLREGTFPKAKDLEKNWKTIKTTLKLTSNKDEKINKWYTRIMKNLEFKKFWLPVYENYFTVDFPQRAMTNETDFRENLSLCKNQGQLGQLGDLYRWNEVNGKRVCLPAENTPPSPNVAKHMVPEFNFSQDSFHIFSKLFGFVGGNANVDSLYDKSTFGRVLHKRSMEDKVAANLDWTRSPMESAQPSASSFDVPTINITPPSETLGARTVSGRPYVGDSDRPMASRPMLNMIREEPSSPQKRKAIDMEDSRYQALDMGDSPPRDWKQSRGLWGKQTAHQEDNQVVPMDLDDDMELLDDVRGELGEERKEQWERRTVGSGSSGSVGSVHVVGAGGEVWSNGIRNLKIPQISPIINQAVPKGVKTVMRKKRNNIINNIFY